MKLAKTRAAIGAKLLDVLKPGWAQRIDLDRLDLADCSACVLGQLFGDFGVGAERLFTMRPDTFNAAKECGFDKDGFAESWSSLNVSWRNEITKRQARA